MVLKNPTTLKSKETFKINAYNPTQRKIIFDTITEIFKPDYMNPNKFGFVSSGAYFQNQTNLGVSCGAGTPVMPPPSPDCLKPVGYTRIQDATGATTEIPYVPVPPQYIDFFASVCVNSRDNAIRIEDYPYVDAGLPVRENCRGAVITCGPKLVLNNNVVFTNDLLEQSRFVFRQFQNQDTGGILSNPNPDMADSSPPLKPSHSIVQAETFNPVLVNGRKVGLAGWLFHAGESNPRNAIGKDANGNIYFVYLEGRQKRGGGMNMPAFAELMKSLGCKTALNLDGGGTALHMIKSIRSGCYTYVNPTWPIITRSTRNSSVLELFSKGGKKKKKRTKKYREKKPNKITLRKKKTLIKFIYCKFY